MSVHDEPADGTESAEEPSADFTAQLALLEAENERLRAEYVRARRSQFRRTALGLVLIGGLAALGGIAFPNERAVLFALSGTGVFAGLLTYYLTPERFIAASTGEEIYGSVAENGEAIVAELGLRETRVYVPPGGSSARSDRLFVPQHADYETPTPDELDSVFVVGEERTRGVALHPTGGKLFGEFERALAEELSSDVDLLAEQVADGLTEQFELAGRATPDAEPGRLSVGITDSAYGLVDRFDHPIPSFIGVGIARGLERPVTVETRPVEDDRIEYLVTCRWEAEGSAD